jgi:hypothetical protein
LCYPNTLKVFRRLCFASNWVFRARNACSFEAGLRSPESPFSGQQRLRDIRGRTSVPRIAFFGPAAPSSYSRLNFGSPNHLFRASSAFKIFEAGLRFPESPFSGQQRLQDLRGRASVPRIISFGPAAPSGYSRQGFGPSNCLFRPMMPSKRSSSSCGPSNHPFRACSATVLFKYRRLNPRNAFLGC